MIRVSTLWLSIGWSAYTIWFIQLLSVFSCHFCRQCTVKGILYFCLRVSVVECNNYFGPVGSDTFLIRFLGDWPWNMSGSVFLLSQPGLFNITLFWRTWSWCWGVDPDENCGIIKFELKGSETPWSGVQRERIFIDEMYVTPVLEWDLCLPEGLFGILRLFVWYKFGLYVSGYGDHDLK